MVKLPEFSRSPAKTQVRILYRPQSKNKGGYHEVASTVDFPIKCPCATEGQKLIVAPLAKSSSGLTFLIRVYKQQRQCVARGKYVRSSVGRAAVSKIAGRRFESYRTCLLCGNQVNRWTGKRLLRRPSPVHFFIKQHFNS